MPRDGWDPNGWPASVPAVATLADGLDLDPGVTFLVGENGSGKSTLVEGIGAAWRYSLRDQAPYYGPVASAEDSPLHRHLQLSGASDRPVGGFYLRAEAMHQLYTEVDRGEQGLRPWGGRSLHSYSHGESFLAVLRARAQERGLYIFDEPEAALSFRSCLALLALLDVLRSEGSQVLMATHSPLLLALPDSTILELGDDGITRTSYDELGLVRDWRSFLDEPRRYLRHLLG